MERIKRVWLFDALLLSRGRGLLLLLLLLTLVVLTSREVRAQAPVEFEDVATQLGVLDPSFGRGSAFVDLDRDGLLDIADANTGNQNTIYRQLPGGTFSDVTAAWGGDTALTLSFGVLAADFDNDGDDDLFYNNGGFGSAINSFYRNDLNVPSAMTLVHVSAGAATAAVKGSFGSTAIDYNNDGHLDIFVNQSNGAGGSLFRNDGSLLFSDQSVAAGIPQNYGNGRHCGAIDYDNDGWWDILAGHSSHPTQLFRNGGDGTFLDKAAAAGLHAAGLTLPGFGAVADDLDNDGFQDVLIPIHTLGTSPPTPVFLNNGDGTFSLVSGPGSGMGAQRDMGYTTADLDMDGYPDFFSGTGGPKSDGLLLNALYRILPGGPTGLTFVDITQASGLNASGPSRSHGSPVGDYDRDGDLDFYQNDGGPDGTPSTLETNSLWRSKGNANHWYQLDVEGQLSNRTGVGLRAVAVLPGREVHRWLSVGKGFSNTDAHTLHFGLGADTVMERIELRWPSGITQTLFKPKVDTRSSVVETGIRRIGDIAVGQSFRLDIAGPGNSPVVLLGSAAGLMSTWVPSVGSELGLAPPLTVSAVLSIPQDGVLSLNIQVPGNPALQGATYFVQGFVGTASAGTFTNAVTLDIL